MLFTRVARKAFERLPRAASDAIERHIEALRLDPRPDGCRKLTGADDLWRIRVGDYRVVYSIEDRRVVITIIRIAHRKDIYRGL